MSQNMETTRSRIRTSVQQVASLKPETEFEVIKLILLRERYLQRLLNKLSTPSKSTLKRKRKTGIIDLGIIGLIDTLRDSSIEVVDTIVMWERTQVDYPLVKPFMWNKVNYLTKMSNDYEFLNQFPQINQWLGFSHENNPFLVPPDILMPGVEIEDNSFLVFGQRPPQEKEIVRKKVTSARVIQVFRKSPYLTPIINDTSALAVVNKFNKKTKKSVDGDESTQDGPVDPFESYISAPVVKKVIYLWNILCKVNENLLPVIENRVNRNQISMNMSLANDLNEVTVTSDNTSKELTYGIVKVLPPPPPSTSEIQEKHLITVNVDKTSTSIFTKNVNDYTGTMSNFHSSLDKTAILDDQMFNKELRITSLKNSSVKLGDRVEANQTTSKIWTPHEVILQQLVKKKGGELFVLTAAGSKGRVKAPWRKTRFQRMENDLENLRLQSNYLAKNIEQMEADKQTIIQAMTKAANESLQITNQALTAAAISETSIKIVNDTVSNIISNIIASAEKQNTEKEIVIKQLNLNDLVDENGKVIIECDWENLESSRVEKELEIKIDLPIKKRRKSKNIEALPIEVPEVESEIDIVIRKQNKLIQPVIELREGVELQRTHLQYQYDHFKSIMEDQIGSIEKQRKMHILLDGQTLEGDEKLSISLEDRMAIRIQKLIKYTFGETLRRARVKRIHKAASNIASLFLKVTARIKTKRYYAQLKLAKLLQTWFRSKADMGVAARLRRQAQIYSATRMLQRCYRGYYARKISSLKREFFYNIEVAQDRVSLVELFPGDLDDLADVIEFFIKNYTVELPSALLSLIRCIIYIMNGESGETIVIEHSGYLQNRTINAKNCTWLGAKNILRRKGKLLRKLRAFAAKVVTPNASPFVLTPSCVEACADTLKNYVESDFNCCFAGKKCAIQLYRFVKCVKRIHELQGIFKDYFTVSLPAWFKNLLQYRKNVEKANNRVIMYVSGLDSLKVRMQEFIKSGKKFRYVSYAMKIVESQIKSSKKALKKCKLKVERYLKILQQEILIQIKYNEELQVARAVGVSVVKRDLGDYIRQTFAPQNEVIKELHYSIDKKNLSMLEAQSNVIRVKEQFEKDKLLKDFDAIFKMETLHDYCKQLGVIESDLVVTNEKWKEFIVSIGGVTFVHDLKGSKRDYYLETKNNVLRLMSTRKVLIKKIEESLNKEIKKSEDLAFRERGLLSGLSWDNATSIEIEAENQESIECARRDADIISKSKKTLNRVYIPPTKVHPSILLIDTHIPKLVKEQLIKKLEKLHFSVAKLPLPNLDLATEIQSIFDKGHSAVWFVDFGLHLQARGMFIAFFAAIMAALIPRPKVVCLDATLEMQFGHWHSKFAADFNACTENDYMDSVFTALVLGKIRKIGHVMKLCLCEGAEEEMITTSIPDFFKSRLIEDMNSFIQDIGGNRGGSQGLSHLSSLEHSGMVLAACISAILDLWIPPMSIWTERQIDEGCNAFLDHTEDFNDLCLLLQLQPLPTCKMMKMVRLNQVRIMDNVWDAYSRLDIYENPARYLLAHWCINSLRLMDRLSVAAGSGEHRHDNIDYVVHLRWKDDVCGSEADEIIGKLMGFCLKDCQVFEIPDAEMSYYEKGADVFDLTRNIVEVSTLKSRVCVYYQGSNAYIGVDVNRKGQGCEDNKWTYFGVMEMPNIITMLQPNSTEIFEGRIKNYNVGEGGEDNIFELFANWAKLDAIAENFQVTIMRARFMLFSKIGIVCGYQVRFEMFEEVYGEVYLIIYGASEHALTWKVDSASVASLLTVADATDEKSSLEALDAGKIASIFSDRIELCPSKRWQDFLLNGELEPKHIVRTVKPKLRLKNGPGHLVGRKLLIIGNAKIIFSVYEQNQDTDAHSLRIILYHTKFNQSVEYRLSPMERVLLFSDISDKPLFQQICERFRTVYCNVNDQSRTLFYLGDNFEVDLPDDFSVDGGKEYEIWCEKELSEYALRSSIFTAGSKKENSDESNEKEIDDKMKKKEKMLDAVNNVNELINFNKDNNIDTIDSKWSWACYFYRGIIDKLVGNLTVSVGVNVEQKTFTIAILDTRSMVEGFRTIAFDEACYAFPNRDISFYNAKFKTCDESIVFDVVDEIIGTIQIDKSNKADGISTPFQISMISSNKAIADSIIIALLKLYELPPDDSNIKVPKTHVRLIKPTKSIDIMVLSAKGLSKRGDIAMRDAFCIIKWNMRDVGSTKQVFQSCDPIWERNESKFSMRTKSGQSIKECTLEIEIYDVDINTKAKGDFLGVIIVSGRELDNFLSSENKKSFKLQKSKKLNDFDNKCVSGTLEIVGRVDAVEGSIFKFILEEEETERRKNGMFGGMFGKKNTDESNNANDSRASTPSKSRFSMFGGSRPQTPDSQNNSQSNSPTPSRDASPGRFSMFGGSRPQTPVKDSSRPQTPVKDGSNSNFDIMSPSSLNRSQNLVLLEGNEDDDQSQNLKNDQQYPNVILDNLGTVNNLNSRSLKPGSALDQETVSDFGDGFAVLDCENTIDDEESDNDNSGGDQSVCEEDDDVIEEFADLPTFQPRKRIDLYIQSIEGILKELGNELLLEKKNEVILIVKFNGYEAGKTLSKPWEKKLAKSKPAYSNIDYDINTYFEMYVPPSQELSDCCLEIEMWDWVDLNICYCIATIRGTALVNFIENGVLENSWFSLHRLILPGNLSNHSENNEKNQDLSVESVTTTSPSSMKILLSGGIGDENPLPIRTIAFDVLSVKGIVTNDTTTERGFIVKVSFDGKPIGEVVGILPTKSEEIFPSQHFEVTLPRGSILSKYELIFDVYEIYENEDDEDEINQVEEKLTFVGSKKLEGDELENMMESVMQSFEGKDFEPTVALFNLGKSDTIKIFKRVKGLIEIRGSSIFVTTDVIESIASKQLSTSLIGNSYSILGKSASTEVHDMDLPRFLFSIISLKDGRSNCDIYADIRVYFNGIRVRQITEILKKYLLEFDKTSTDIDNVKKFELFIPRGMQIQSCKLELKVFEMKKSKDGSDDTFVRFLGNKFFVGSELETLMLSDDNIFNKGDKKVSFNQSLSYILEKDKAIKDNTPINIEVDINCINPLSLSVLSIEDTAPKIAIDVDIMQANQLVELDDDIQIDNLFAILRWNGQEVRRLIPSDIKIDPDSTSSIIIWGNEKVRLFIPINQKLQNCSLDISVWNESRCLGCTVMQRKTLVDFARKKNSNNDRINNTVSEVQIDSWFDLDLPWSINRSIDTSILGKIQLYGKKVLVKKPKILEASEESLESINNNSTIVYEEAPDVAYMDISTELDEDTIGWKFYFPRYIDNKSRKLTNIEKIASILLGSTVVNTVSDGVSTDFTVETEEEDSIGEEIIIDEEIVMDEKEVVELKVRCDFPSVKFVDDFRILEDDDRVAWRGRVLPKFILTNDTDANKEIFISRSSRLVRTKTIKDLRILADIHYLHDESDTSKHLTELPICVTEQLSDGPNVVKRMYRIELLSNSGMKLGATDIQNDDDLRLVIGKPQSDTFLQGDRDKWDLPSIFKYIVQERTILDMRPKEKSKDIKGGATNSLVSLIRDDKSVLTSIPKSVTKSVSLGKLNSKKILNADSIGDVSLVESISGHTVRMQWIRLYSVMKKVSGVLFRIQVLLQARIWDLYYNTNKFFSTDESSKILEGLDLICRCSDQTSMKKNKIVDLKISGEDLIKWNEDEKHFYPIDLTTSFRRSNFAKFIVDNLQVRYAEFGGYDFDLVSVETGKIHNKDGKFKSFAVDCVEIDKEEKEIEKEDKEIEAEENINESSVEEETLNTGEEYEEDSFDGSSLLTGAMDEATIEEPENI
jgi:hypothetical protein